MHSQSAHWYAGLIFAFSVSLVMASAQEISSKEEIKDQRAAEDVYYSPRARVQSSMGTSSRDLNFEQRVEAQRAIERVYWSNRIWPKENRSSKPPLEQIMPEVLIR